MAFSHAEKSGAKNLSIVVIQELAKKPLTSLSEYSLLVRDNDEIGTIQNDGPNVPIIDLQNLIHGEATELELEKLHSACRDWGFFQLVNHGISPAVLENLKCEIEEFFKLPLEEKMKYKTKPGDVEGYGAAIRADKKLDWGDKVLISVSPPRWIRPHLLPQFPPPLRSILEAYIVELQILALKILGFLGNKMKMEKGGIEEMFEEGIQSLRITYYPPCPQAEQIMGLAAHSDASGITILNQLNGVDALQVKKDEVWIPVKVISGALVVNIGDVLEIVSNGMYKSVVHRAMVSRDKERFSLGMFINPKCESKIGPAPNLISPENPPLYKTMLAQEFVDVYLSRNKMDGKTWIEEQLKLKQ